MSKCSSIMNDKSISEMILKNIATASDYQRESLKFYSVLINSKNFLFNSSNKLNYSIIGVNNKSIRIVLSFFSNVFIDYLYEYYISLHYYFFFNDC